MPTEESKIKAIRVLTENCGMIIYDDEAKMLADIVRTLSGDYIAVMHKIHNTEDGVYKAVYTAMEHLVEPIMGKYTTKIIRTAYEELIRSLTQACMVVHNYDSDVIYLAYTLK